MINIYFLIASLNKCGPNNVVKGIKDNLPISFTPSLVVLKQTSFDEQIDDNELIKRCDVRFVKSSNLLEAIKLLKEIKNSDSSAVFHTNCFRGDISLGIVKYFYPEINVVQTFHNYPLKDYRLAYGNFLGKFMAVLTYHFGRRANVSVACSKSVGLHLSGKRINPTVIENGVDVSKFSIKKNDKVDELRSSLGIDSNEIVFGYVGALISRKKVDLTLDSFIDSEVNGKFLVVGSGDQEDSLKEKYNRNSKVIFLGDVENPSVYYNLLDYYISSSVAEGLPNAVMESLASGTPVILSDIPPHKELSELDGVTIFKEKKDLIAAIRFSSNDGKNSLIRSSISLGFAKSKFTSESMSLSYQIKYMNLF